MSAISQNQWSEETSQAFIDYGRYFVPKREAQIQIITSLVPQPDLETAEPFEVLELCCGEGLIAEALLLRYPRVRYTGLDGSPGMLRRAEARLAQIASLVGGATEGRYRLDEFDLAANNWRHLESRYQAAISSLAVHHLDGEHKQALFKDVFAMLAPGGAFLIADIIQPTHRLGWDLAAATWDNAVKQCVQQFHGDEDQIDPYEFFENEGWNIFRYFDPADIDKPSPLFDQLKWLEQAGFSAVDVFWMEAGHAIFGGYK